MRAAIRNSITSKLNNTLPNSYSSDDFDILDTNYGFKILYRYAPEYSFSADFNNDSITIEESPSSIDISSSFSVKGRESLLRAISNWVDYLDEEIRALPQTKILQKQSERLNELERRFNEVSDDHFTEEEVAQLRNKLEEIEARMLEQLMTNNQENESIKKELSQIKNEMQQLKNQLDVFTKRGWIKALAGKIIKWGAEHPDEIREISTEASHLLGEASQTVADAIDSLI